MAKIYSSKASKVMLTAIFVAILLLMFSMATTAIVQDTTIGVK